MSYSNAFLDGIEQYMPELLYSSPDTFGPLAGIVSTFQRRVRAEYDIYSHGRYHWAEETAQTAQAAQTLGRTSPLEASTRPSRRDRGQDGELHRGLDRYGDEETPQYATRHPTAPGSAPITPTVTFPTTIAPTVTFPTAITPTVFSSLFSTPPRTQPTVTLPDAPRRRQGGGGLESELFRSLFQLFDMPVTDASVSVFMSNLEPVPVAPTAEQIAANTRELVVGETDTYDPCAICLEGLRAGETARRLLGCRHTFHRACIDTWFQRHVHCPSCRADVRQGGVTAPLTPQGGASSPLTPREATGAIEANLSQMSQVD